MKKLIAGIIVSVIFIWFSMRGVEYEEVFKALENINYVFLLPTIMLFLCMSFLRSVRWGVILSPMERIDQRRLFPITCVGYMAIALIPMRIGEFIRPYLVSSEGKIPLSSALATILVERVFDVLTLLGILFLVFISSTLPVWVVKSGYSDLFTFVVLICVLFILYYKTEFCLKLSRPLLNKLPLKFNVGIEGLVRNFVEGFKIISSPKRLFYTLFLSVLIWASSGLGIYCLFFFHDFRLPIASTFLVLVIVIIGISLPVAPGFVGNFQFACTRAGLFIPSKNI